MNDKFKASSIYDFTVKDLHDKDVNLAKYDNSQLLLIVNFATNDDLADRNFLELKEIKQKFCDDIAILLFPCCQFGSPMSERKNSEIFCWAKFEGIEFAEVFSMVDVNGPKAHPLFKYLTQQQPPAVEWNFTKFLVDKRGQVIKRFIHSAPFADIENTLKQLT